MGKRESAPVYRCVSPLWKRPTADRRRTVRLLRLFKYRRRLLRAEDTLPVNVLDFKWAPEIQRRAKRLADSHYRVAEVRTKSEHLVMEILQTKAMEEEPCFMPGTFGEGR